MSTQKEQITNCCIFFWPKIAETSNNGRLSKDPSTHCSKWVAAANNLYCRSIGKKPRTCALYCSPMAFLSAIPVRKCCWAPDPNMSHNETLMDICWPTAGDGFTPTDCLQEDPAAIVRPKLPKVDRRGKSENQNLPSTTLSLRWKPNTKSQTLEITKMKVMVFCKKMIFRSVWSHV